MCAVAAASAVETAPISPGPATAHHDTRPSVVSIGTIVWLSSELMFFAGLFAMYFTIRSVSVGKWPPTDDPHHPVHLNVPYSAVFTVILVASSWTCQKGVFAAERGDVRKLKIWYLITLAMGATFISGQAYEYFGENDFTISSHPYGSVYYLTTGFHGLHVLGGLIAFLMVLARASVGSWTPQKATSAIVVSYYWHFVDVVWVALYATIYLLQ
jgi:cytochrome c oxidase subunit 3